MGSIPTRSRYQFIKISVAFMLSDTVASRQQTVNSPLIEKYVTFSKRIFSEQEIV